MMTVFPKSDSGIYYDDGLYCCGCKERVVPILIYGTDVYPHRIDLADKLFWYCIACGNYVGCHPGGDRPLGNIPTPELRKARQHIHAILDPIWKSKRLSRSAIYAMISEQVGWNYHTAKIRTIEEARKVYQIVQGISRKTSGGQQ